MKYKACKVLSLIMLFAFTLTFSVNRAAYAEDKITWMITDWPPWMILDGEDAGKGRFNYILDAAKENLPNYEHVTERMNFERFWYEVNQKNNICYLFGLKTGNRGDIVYYSEPHTILLPNAIIMRATDLKKLGNPEQYSIIELLEDKRFKGLTQKSRSFTTSVDSLLQTHETGSNLNRVSESAESLIKMVSTGRIDYTLEYPIVASYYGQQLTDGFDPLVSIPISEMEPLSYAYMNCTKNEWGKQVIDEWNSALLRIKPTEEYRRITEVGHTDKKELEIIREAYADFINAKQ